MHTILDVPPPPSSSPQPAEREDTSGLVRELVALGTFLAAQDYHFTAVTPLTHACFLARDQGVESGSLRSIFGWNQPFAEQHLPTAVLDRLRIANLVTGPPSALRSVVRYATIGRRLYAHDGFPTVSREAVFFGPDTYRFVAAVRRHLRPCRLLIDVGCGTGAGGLEATNRAERIVLSDVSSRALAFAAANTVMAHAQGVTVNHGDLLAGCPAHPDAIIANPPYLLDPLGRTYRHGAGTLGSELSIRLVREALSRLAPGGQLILYTGSPIIAGHDSFEASVLPLVTAIGADATYEELDPDVFGEELEQLAYAHVERIAAVLLLVTMPFHSLEPTSCLA